jgi:hypothetical protein
MGTPAEDEIVAIKTAIANITRLLAFTVEGVARTGAFDRAGTGGHVLDLLTAMGTDAEALGDTVSHVVLRGAKERVRNVPHINRLSD